MGTEDGGGGDNEPLKKHTENTVKKASVMQYQKPVSKHLHHFMAFQQQCQSQHVPLDFY